MSESVVSPRLANRRLAYGLTEMRESLGWSQAQAAKAVGCGTSRIANVEVRRNVPSEELIADLLRVYDRESELSDFLALRETAKQSAPQWRGVDRTAFILGFDEFVELESSAERIEGYEHRLVPGILQTRSYAAGVMTSSQHPADLNRKLDVRERRQEALTRETSPVHLWMVVEEQALDRPVGDADVMRGQFDHLLELSDLNNVELQIAPTSVGPHRGLISSFVVLRFHSPRDPGLAAVETPVRTVFFEEEVNQFGQEMDLLRALALPQQESARLIAKKRKGV